MTMINKELNKAVDKELKVICLTCKNSNKHRVLSSVDIKGKESMGDGDWYHWDTSYQIIECQGCGDISFRKEHSNSEDFDTEDGYAITELIFPKRSKNTWNSKDFFNIPYTLRRIYRETIDSYNNDNPTLCAAGVRALVEGLCKENDVTDGEVEITKEDGTIIKKRLENLQGKINGLFEKGKLTKENAETLHEHRFLGNNAIHDLSAPTQEELSLAIEIVEHVFDTLYEIPEKASRLKYERLRKERK
jgi:hypothetical protein